MGGYHTFEQGMGRWPNVSYPPLATPPLHSIPSSWSQFSQAIVPPLPVLVSACWGHAFHMLPLPSWSRHFWLCCWYCRCRSWPQAVSAKLMDLGQIHYHKITLCVQCGMAWWWWRLFTPGCKPPFSAADLSRNSHWATTSIQKLGYRAWWDIRQWKLLPGINNLAIQCSTGWKLLPKQT